MPTVTFEPRIVTRLPEKWDSYTKAARKDRGQARPQREKRLYTGEEINGIVCDATSVLMDSHDKPYPGAKALLENFKTQGRFIRVIICSSGKRELRVAQDFFGSCADDYHYVPLSLIGAETSLQAEFASRRNFAFLVEDGHSADDSYDFIIGPREEPHRNIWTIDPHIKEYTPERIAGINKALVALRRQLKKL